MSYKTEYAIAGQNAGTTAGTILAALIANRGDTEFNADEYNTIRNEVFNGTLALAGAETVVESLEGVASGMASPPADNVRPFPADTRPAGPRGGGNYGGAGTVVVKFGKYSGRTIEDIHGEDPSYVEWMADKSNNQFLKDKAREFLAG